MGVVAFAAAGTPMRLAHATEVKSMVDERLVASGTGATGAIRLMGYASFINGLRAIVNETNWINTTVHSGGNIEGATMITKWTKTALLTASAAGNGSNWTNIPARIGTPSYGTTLESNTPFLIEHINEIISVARLLTAVGVYPTLIDNADRSGDGEDDDSDETTAKANALAEANAAWIADTWQTQAGESMEVEAVQSYSAGVSLAAVQLYNLRGKLRFNFSTNATGSARVFMNPTVKTNGIGNNPAPVTANGQYHAYASATPGATYTTGLLCDTRASILSDWGSSPKTTGWGIDIFGNAMGVAVPIFVYL